MKSIRTVRGWLLLAVPICLFLALGAQCGLRVAIIGIPVQVAMLAWVLGKIRLVVKSAIVAVVLSLLFFPDSYTGAKRHFEPTPYSISQFNFHVMKTRLRVFHEQYERYPARLRELQDFMRDVQDFMGDEKGDADGWKQPIQYTRTNGSVEVRSAGPDGVLGTGDDCVLSMGTDPEAQVTFRLPEHKKPWLRW